GSEVGAGAVDELVLEAPLLLADEEDVRLHVSVTGADEHGRRTVIVRSRSDSDEEWTVHARGVVAPSVDSAPAAPADVWPPVDAEKVDVSALYDEFAAAGYEYGPLFQGVRAVWRRSGEVFAEVGLPHDESTGAGIGAGIGTGIGAGAGAGAGFGVHPALLDAALHALVLIDPEADG
ncbi:polyketide synthase dehydratase domain-containing protein, partial [Streptomyces sp. 5-8]|nr:polyketide synthase dehydratase domain-containing protein [Streptomyces musisoli]